MLYYIVKNDEGKQKSILLYLITNETCLYYAIMCFSFGYYRQ